MLAALKLKTAFLVGMVLLLALLAACGSSSTTAPQATAAPEPTATPAAGVPVAEPSATQGMFMIRAPESNPKRGGVLRWAGLSDSPHFDAP